MSKNKYSQALPKRRSGLFLKIIQDRGLSTLLWWGVLAYVAVVLFFSLVQIAIQFFGYELILDSNNEKAAWFDVIYFNFITVLTVGYGDFKPVGIAKIMSGIEAFAGVGLFGIVVSLFTVKVLKAPSNSIVFSKYAYYCTDEQRFMIIFVNTGAAQLARCDISSYFKLGRDWSVAPSCNPPFITQAVQTFFIDEVPEEDIRQKLTDGDCLRVCVGGNLLGSEIAATVQYNPDQIIIIPNRNQLTAYKGFWKPDFSSQEFQSMFHYRPQGSETLSERCTLKS